MKLLNKSLFSVLLIIFSAFSQANFKEEARKEFEKSSTHDCVKGFSCFKLSNNYPKNLPKAENYPWLSIDFKTNPKEYMDAVFEYVIEGNIETNWDVSKNTTRKWFHAPWMHNGSRGREPIHGLTKERGSRWHELSVTQTRRTNNWAVGFYNAPGGYVFSQVWKNPSNPDSKKAQFPVGTVSAKILFTDTTDNEAPFMKSDASLTWFAQTEKGTPPKKLRLLQMDIAVKDSRANAFTGWIFGTFMFDGNTNKAKYWENIIPVGLQWGNDPNLTFAEYKAGKRPQESWVNPYVKNLFKKRPPFAELGYLGRMNGPVDSPFSSCLACHGRAIDTKGRQRHPAFTPKLIDMCIRQLSKNGNTSYEVIKNCSVKEEAISVFFRNLKSNESFLPNTTPLDYSLQLAGGLASWNIWFKENYPDLYAQRLTQSLTSKNKSFVTPHLIPTLPPEKAFSRGDKDL